MTTQGRKQVASSVDHELSKGSDSLKLGDRLLRDNKNATRVILFDRNGQVKEYQESAIKLHHH